MKIFTCNKCKNMIHKSSHIDIYSGFLCSHGNWDERGFSTDEIERIKNKFERISPAHDSWTFCQRFYPINFNR